MKRLLAFVLSLVMLLGSIPFTPVHVHAEDVEDLLVAEPVQEPEAAEPEEIVPEETEEVAPEETEEVIPEESEEIILEEIAELIPEETEEEISEETISEEAEAVASEEEETVVEELFYVPTVDLPDNETMFEAYAEYTLYGENTLHSKDVALYGTAAGKRLSGDEKKLYDALVPIMKKIADGQRSSTIIKVGRNETDANVTFTGSGFNSTTFGRVIDALLCDLPYAQYWYDKTSGVSASQSFNGSKLNLITLRFIVDDYYKGSDDYTANTSKTGAAKKSADKAQNIVNKYAGKNDYEKLVGYKNEICALVEYDHGAAERGDFNINNNPWQLIWCFDGNSSTNIVCEGYSKAYQYLCDLSDFSGDVECYSVYGVAGGPHMWNHVKIGGKNYMVDITNSDSGSIGQNGGLFLSGGSGSISGGYYFINGYMHYTFDAELKDLFGTGSSSILYLSSTDYKYTPTCSHSWSSWYQTVAPTCTAKGTERRDCTKCGEYETREVAATGHNYTEKTIPASCIEYGYVVYTCANCGDTYTDNYKNPLGHDLSKWTVTKAASCVADGEQRRECSRCDFFETQVIPSTGKHNYVPVVTKPTCTAQGYTTYTCGCGESYVADYVKALGHAWDNGVVTKEPTETTTGIRTKTCTRCGATTTEVIPVKEHIHSYSKTVTAPTCTEKGYTTYTCSCGDSYVKDYVSPIGHKYTDKVTEPSCTEGGYTTHVCANCGDTYVDSYTSPKGHAWDEGVVIKRPTDTESGIRVFTCTTCGASDEQIIPAGHYEHTYKKTVTAPTYTKKGYTTYTCDVCGESYVDDYVDALGLPKPASVKAKTDPVTGGALLTWEHDGEASCYKVYQATSSKGKYKVVATVTEATATVSVPAGKTYYFKVKAICEDDDSLNSGYSAVVKATGKCGQPQVTAEAGSTGKPVIKWKKVTGAKKYDVYRATSEDGKYTKQKTVTGTSYTDTKASGGKTYFYKVKAIASKSTYNSVYSEIVSCRTLLAKPTLTAAVNTATGKPKLTWKKVTGADLYRIYRAESEDGEFVLLDSQTALSYEDATAVIDTDYWYQIVAVDEANEANNSESSIKKVHATMAKPNVTFASNRETGKPMLTWDEVEGAVEYKVYRSTSSTKSFKVVATFEAGETLEYIDTSVATGKGYYYKVTAVGENSTTTSAVKKVYATCSAPVVTVEAGSTGKPVLKWKKVSGATKYDVYRATSEDGKYTKVTTTTKLTYTDSKATGGKTYFYKVKALGKSSTLTSNYSEIVSQTCVMAAPTVKASNASGYVKLTWNAVTGAGEYIVFRAPAGSDDFAECATVEGTSYTDKDMEVGQSYTYCVQAIHASNPEANSGLSKPVTCGRKLSAPEVRSEATGNAAAVLLWEADPYAVKYTISQATSKTGTYKKLGTVDVDGQVAMQYFVSVPVGKTYYFKVVANGADKSVDSSATVIAVTGQLGAPTMKKTVDATKNTIKISWNKLSGASGYNIYRRDAYSGDSWTKVGTTTSTSYTNKSVSAGQYEYCVSAYKTVSKKKQEGMKSDPIVTRTMAAPTIDVPQPSNYKIVVYWGAVDGATSYELRYYTNKDSTKRNLGTFTDQYSYTHSVSAGAYYYYQVRGICEENGVTTYGPYVTTPSDMAWGWVHKDGTHKPSFKYILTGNTYSSTYTMVIGIINNGPDTMRFTTSGGKWIDGSSSSYNRSIKLYDYETFDKYETLKEVSYQEIGPGETGYVIVAVKGNPTRYNKNTTIRLGLEYCGKKYGVDFNYYKCTYYAK